MEELPPLQMGETNEVLMKTRKADLIRWRLKPSAPQTILKLQRFSRIVEKFAELALALWLCGVSARILQAQDLNPRLLGSWYGLTNAVVSDLAVSGDYAFIVDDHAGLHVIDVGASASPQRVGGFNTVGTSFGVGIQGHHAYVVGDGGFAGDDGTHRGVLEVLDVSDQANPRQIADFLSLPQTLVGRVVAEPPRGSRSQAASPT